MRKRILAAIFSAVMVLVLAGCKKADGNHPQGAGANTGGSAGGAVYVPDYQDLGGEGASCNNVVYRDGFLYYSLYGSNAGLYRYDADARTAEKIELPETDEEMALVGAMPGTDGGYHALYLKIAQSAEDPKTYENTYYLARYDASMNTLYKNEITEQVLSQREGAVLQHFAADANGNVCINMGTVLLLYDGDGNFLDNLDTLDGKDSGSGNLCAEQVIESGLTRAPMQGPELWSIIREESSFYFSGAKSAEEAADLIQRRISIYVSENM